MPELVAYYPVLAKVLLKLEGHSIVSYRVAIVTKSPDWTPGWDVIHRFVSEYTGRHWCAGEMYVNDPDTPNKWRSGAVAHLNERVRKLARHEGKTFEPMKEIEIDLRPSTVTVVE